MEAACVVIGAIVAAGFNRAHGWIAFAIGSIAFVLVCVIAEALHRRDARRSETQNQAAGE